MRDVIHEQHMRQVTKIQPSVAKKSAWARVNECNNNLPFWIHTHDKQIRAKRISSLCWRTFCSQQRMVIDNGRINLLSFVFSLRS